MLGLTISALGPQHLAETAALEKLCFGVHWTPTNFAKELENPRCHYYAAVDSRGRLMAYLGYWRILEEAHITAVGVHPDCRKRRIAQQLLCRMLDDCLEQQVNWITLEVKASNLAAQKLYEKFGFSVMGRRKNYYQAEREDALIMWTEDISQPAYQAHLQTLKMDCTKTDFQERNAS